MKPARPLLASLALLAVPGAASAQTDFVFGAPSALRETPRALDVFRDVGGYAEFTADRHGTVTQPLVTELGADLLMRMFRNICLGIERGASLADVTPEGFAPYATLPYSFGDIAAPDYEPGRRVLSFTGSIDADEENGHPVLWLQPENTGMTCQIEWHVGPDVPDDRQGSIATYFDEWVPWAFALVHASRPNRTTDAPRANVTEWDRPCGDRWCPMTITYNFPAGRISVDTTLNITDIQGARP